MKHHPPHSSPPSSLQSAEELLLLEGLHQRSYSEGELLGRPGSERDSILIVRSGRIRVYLAFADKEYTLTFLEAGDIYSTHSGAYLEAVRPTEVMVGSTAQILGKLRQAPSAFPVIIRVLGRTLANCMQLIEDLAFRDVEGRLARFLQGMLARKGLPGQDGVLLELDLNTEDIASLLGTSRQTASSLINKLAREGILSRAGQGNFVIHQPDRLTALSQKS